MNDGRTHETEFRTVVGRGTDLCLGLSQGVLQSVCDPEISDFDLHVRSQEDVRCLDVSMKDLPLMAVTDRETDLHEPSNDLILGEGESL